MHCHKNLLGAIVCLFVALFVTPTQAKAENWPNWRGPAGIGISNEKNMPLTWSSTENIRWKIKLPERGNSTPIVWGNRIYLTQPVEAEQRRTLMCLDRTGGKVLWQAGTTYASKEPTHATNPFCSASPVTDGQRVISWFGSAGLFCHDMKGRQLWRQDLGIQEHEWGYAASPVIHGDLCFLNFGPGTREFVVALDKLSGREVWRYEIPKSKRPEADEGLRGSWATPLVIQTAGREELIMALPDRVVAFDPPTGKILWQCEGLGSLVYASPMWGDGVLVVLGGYHRACLAVRPGGSGDVSATHRLWHEPKSKLRLGTGIIHKGHFYINDMQGVVQCCELATNKAVWEKRLKASAGDNATWSSLVMTADENIYMANQAGDTFVFKASPTFELLATNSLSEMTNSSTVLSDGEIFVRTHEHLWSIGTTKK